MFAPVNKRYGHCNLVSQQSQRTVRKTFGMKTNLLVWTFVFGYFLIAFPLDLFVGRIVLDRRQSMARRLLSRQDSCRLATIKGQELLSFCRLPILAGANQRETWRCSATAEGPNIAILPLRDKESRQLLCTSGSCMDEDDTELDTDDNSNVMEKSWKPDTAMTPNSSQAELFVSNINNMMSYAYFTQAHHISPPPFTSTQATLSQLVYTPSIVVHDTACIYGCKAEKFSINTLEHRPKNQDKNCGADLVTTDITSRFMTRNPSPAEFDYSSFIRELGWPPVDTINCTFDATTQFIKLLSSTSFETLFWLQYPAIKIDWRNESVATDTVPAAPPPIGSLVPSVIRIIIPIVPRFGLCNSGNDSTQGIRADLLDGESIPTSYIETRHVGDGSKKLDTKSSESRHFGATIVKKLKTSVFKKLDTGSTSAQFFIGTESLVADVQGMKSDKQFVNTLEDNIRRRGAQTKLISDRAQVEIGKKVKDILRILCIDDWQSEPHKQFQNPFE